MPFAVVQNAAAASKKTSVAPIKMITKMILFRKELIRKMRDRVLMKSA